MNIKLLIAFHVALAAAGAAYPAAAAVVEALPNADVTSTPYVIDFGPGGSLTFNNDTNGLDSSIGVQTSGTVEVFSTFGEPAYFQPFATTQFPSDQLGGFAAYATPAAVPFSISSGSLGFEYVLGDGVHYGVAKIGGATIGQYYVQTTPGADIGLAVPEPSAWTMMLAGFALLGGTLRARRRPARRQAGRGAGDRRWDMRPPASC